MAGRRIDAPGLSHALVGVTLMIGTSTIQVKAWHGSAVCTCRESCCEPLEVLLMCEYFKTCLCSLKTENRKEIRTW